MHLTFRTLLLVIAAWCLFNAAFAYGFSKLRRAIPPSLDRKLFGFFVPGSIPEREE